MKRTKRTCTKRKEGDNNYYTVEKILEKRIRNRKVEYKVKWKNFSLEQSTWEPLCNLVNVMHMVYEFRERIKPKDKKQCLLIDEDEEKEEEMQKDKSISINKKRKRSLSDKNQASEDKTKTISNSLLGIGQELENVVAETNSISSLQRKVTSKNKDKEEEEEDQLIFEEIVSVKKINDKLYAVVNYYQSSDLEKQIKKDTIETSVLANIDPFILIKFYESKIKFASKE